MATPGTMGPMSSRFASRSLLCAALLLAALVFDLRGGRGARAQAVPSVEALRAELAQLTASSPKLPEGALLSIAYTIDVAERIAKGFAPQSEDWRSARASWLAHGGARARSGARAARQDRDARLRSPISRAAAGLRDLRARPTTTRARAYPLLIVLHGGSANGNLFLGVVLGNNMNWKEYDDAPLGRVRAALDAGRGSWSRPTASAR